MSENSGVRKMKNHRNQVLLGLFTLLLLAFSIQHISTSTASSEPVTVVEVCQWDENLTVDAVDCVEPIIEICEWDENLTADAIDCVEPIIEICEWNENLTVDAVDCVEPIIEVCQWDENLTVDSADCFKTVVLAHVYYEYVSDDTEPMTYSSESQSCLDIFHPFLGVQDFGAARAFLVENGQVTARLMIVPADYNPADRDLVRLGNDAGILCAGVIAGGPQLIAYLLPDGSVVGLVEVQEIESSIFVLRAIILDHNALYPDPLWGGYWDTNLSNWAFND